MQKKICSLDRVKKVMTVSNVDCYCKNIYLEAYILSYFYHYLSLDLFYSLIILIAVLTLTRKKFVSTQNNNILNFEVLLVGL